jgi:hypothetical protein
MCGKWILAHICYAFGFAPKTGCDSYDAAYTRAFAHTLTRHGESEFGQEISTVTKRGLRSTNFIRLSMLHIIMFLCPPVGPSAHVRASLRL